MKIIKKGKKKKGFTLIELIAVVAILLILAAILIPNIVGYMQRSKIATVKSNAKAVLNVIKTAQANSDSGSITTYSAAINADGNLKLSGGGVTNGLATADENTLENLINDNSNTWANFSGYY
ncbi:prepilin-type N-terminal cleavage/methylation domain-containing protein [Clostridium hydrogenum]|uniref:prepilin-type N-terminal cleavage/methylation domain-containing protein n=1 Tax=Clostridium hydrogenum TaxID=2855764 RepID=UPI001F339A93|nr:prepilin-type N-terminal cleavage/methylation domain-containing protein [Clostridium hydrogenum]